jgi:hypothetical protein
MPHSHSIQNNCLIVVLSKVEELSFIESLFSSECKHLILDLTEVLDLNINHLIKFTTFGKNLVKHSSFVMISNQFFQEDFLIVPSLQEAFDIIEMEDIERSLKL